MSLRSKALTATLKQREEPRWRKISAREIAEWFDSCRLREPVYAWLWANMAQVQKARRAENGHNPMHWSAIARLMEFKAIKGARGELPNGDSVTGSGGGSVRTTSGGTSRGRA